MAGVAPGPDCAPGHVMSFDKQEEYMVPSKLRGTIMLCLIALYSTTAVCSHRFLIYMAPQGKPGAALCLALVSPVIVSLILTLIIVLVAKLYVLFFMLAGYIEANVLDMLAYIKKSKEKGP